MKLEKLLYTKPESAEIWGVSRFTVNKYVQLGQIQTRRFGRRVLIPADEVRRVAAEGMRAAAPASQ